MNKVIYLSQNCQRFQMSLVSVKFPAINRELNLSADWHTLIRIKNNKHVSKTTKLTDFGLRIMIASVLQYCGSWPSGHKSKPPKKAKPTHFF